MLAFFDHPEQWHRLLADPALIPTAGEEIIRWVSPVNLFRRTAICDTELAGRKIAEGDKVVVVVVVVKVVVVVVVVVFYTSADRDEDVFALPQEFDIGRDPYPHIGCGAGGPHFCLGKAPGRARAAGTAAGPGREDARYRPRRGGQQTPVQFR